MSAEDFMVVSFEPTGEVHAMHRDDFDLGFLGKQEVARASEIKFHEESQKWDICMPPGAGVPVEQWQTFPALQGFAGYNEARKFEVKWLEHVALKGVPALSDAGRELARDLRDGVRVTTEPGVQ